MRRIIRSLLCAAVCLVPVVCAAQQELQSLEEVERDLISRTLEKTNWSKRKTAQILGISERTLYRKINEYNLQE